MSRPLTAGDIFTMLTRRQQRPTGRPVLCSILFLSLGALAASCGDTGQTTSTGAGQGGGSSSGTMSSGQGQGSGAQGSGAQGSGQGQSSGSSSGSGQGSCSGAKDCDDQNPCTDDACPQGTCVHTPRSCEDGSVCTADTCDPKLGCVHAPIVYFSEGFADNTQGWNLGNTWQIGSATTSSGETSGNGDPAEDHTPTADNGVAGVLIGGNTVSPAVFPGPINHLTSPVIDLSAAAGPVVLQFSRWLNSDFLPFMQNSIEVFDGNAWVPLWASEMTPIEDKAWTNTGEGPAPTQFDVTARKNAKFQFRFSYQIRQVGVARSGTDP
jgi:hypothetical protein